MKKSIDAYFTNDIPFRERFAMIQDVGFDATMLLWKDSPQGEDKSTQIFLAQHYNLTITNIHADYDNINQLWSADGNVHDRLYDTVRDCNNYGIDTLIVHLSSSPTPPPYNTIGLSRIATLVDIATKYNVRLAIENLRLPTYNKYIFDNIDSPLLGQCYDCAHANIYCKDYDVVSYLNRPVFACHIHDNDGVTDSHLLPFSGNIDWHNEVNTLRPHITSELNIESRNTTAMDNYTFVTQAYNATNQLIQMIKGEYSC